MTQYLLAAEINKIQSFITQSSRLREVIGASHLLKQFCDDVPRYLGLHENETLISAGGNFRLLFPDRQSAKEAQAKLYKFFDKRLGGLITITDPLEYDGKSTSTQQANHKLRTAKYSGNPATPVWHLPYHAVCASCGVELAMAYRKPIDRLGEPEKYLCQQCQNKAEVPARHYLSEDEVFKDLTFRDSLTFDQDVTEVSNYGDARQYIAYLVADGNRMGEYFGKCPAKHLPEFSKQVGHIAKKALRHAAEKLPVLERRPSPFLPLIIGGDDVFALFPATWAMDVASRYASNYQAEMTKALEQYEISGLAQGEQATTGVAVVICKSSYPYQSAYNHAKSLLERAKNKSKGSNDYQSRMIVDVILGSTVATQPQHQTVATDPQIHTRESATTMLRWRLALKDIPSRTLIALAEALEQGQEIESSIGRVRQRNTRNADCLQEARQELKDQGLWELVKLWDFTFNSAELDSAYTSGEAQ